VQRGGVFNAAGVRLSECEHGDLWADIEARPKSYPDPRLIKSVRPLLSANSPAV